MCLKSLCNNYQYYQRYSKLALDVIVNSGVQHHSTHRFDTDVIFRVFLIHFG